MGNLKERLKGEDLSAKEKTITIIKVIVRS